MSEEKEKSKIEIVQVRTLSNQRLLSWLSETNRCPDQMKVLAKEVSIKWPNGSCEETIGFEMTTGSYKIICPDKNGNKRQVMTGEAGLIFPVDLKIEDCALMLVEGETDLAAIYPHYNFVAAVPGANCVSAVEKSETRLREIFSKRSPEFLILFDSDAAGCTGAKAIAKKIFELFPQAIVAIFDWTDIPAKDARAVLQNSALGLPYLQKGIESASRFSRITFNLEMEVLEQKIQMIPTLDFSDVHGLIATFLHGEADVYFIKSGLDDPQIGIVGSDDKLTVASFEEDLASAQIKNVDIRYLAQNITKQSDGSFVGDLLDHIRQSIYFSSPTTYNSFAAYVVLSFCWPIFERIPFVHLWGGRGTGKSKCGELFADLCFNGEHFEGSSIAVLRRHLHRNRGLISLDDTEFLSGDSEETQEFRSQLNGSYRTRAKATLCDVNKRNKPMIFHIGGPKIFGNIKGLESVLSSRCITVKTDYAPSDFRPKINLPSKDLGILRTKILCFVMQNTKSIRDNYHEIMIEASREMEVRAPLLAIAKTMEEKFPKYASDCYQSVQESLNESLRLKRESLGRTADEYLVVALKRHFELEPVTNADVSAGDIVTWMISSGFSFKGPNEHAHATEVGTLLASLNLFKDKRRKTGEVGQKETRYMIDRSKLDFLAGKFNIDEARPERGVQNENPTE